MFKLSDKYIDFIHDFDTHVDILEGTTQSGKTTIGAGVKFMMKVMASDKKIHVIASKTTGTAEKNIIQQDNGILDIYPDATYMGNGDRDNKIPHIRWRGKVIYILGYDNQDKWQNALGSQFGCVFIDEINTAHIEFIREIWGRNDYVMATLNPDNPDLSVYKEYINHSRPLEKYTKHVPPSIMKDLQSVKAIKGWRYWFFDFEDNKGNSAEKIAKTKMMYPEGTKIHKNKVLGLRGKSSGVVFGVFSSKNIITKKEAQQYIRLSKYANAKQREYFDVFVGSMDTSYSSKSPDTIAMTYQGITNKGRLIALDEKTYNNRDLKDPIAPSDNAVNFIDFLNRNKDEWGFGRQTFVDSADSGTITELNKIKRKKGTIYIFNPSWKKMKIVDRINMEIGWIMDGSRLVVETCINLINEYGVYSWDEKKDNVPEDANDHMINSEQYGWIPYKNKIGLKND